jgi:hypothetical protein
MTDPPLPPVGQPLPGVLHAERGRVTRDGNFALACWHAETDTLPRVVGQRGDPDRVALVLPIGVASNDGETARVEVRLWTEPPEPAERRFRSDGGGIEVLNRSILAREVRRGSPLRGEPAVLDARRHDVDLDRAVTDAGDGTTFYRLVVADLPRDALVHYTISATTPMVDVAARCSFTLRASIPEFTAQDVRAVQLPAAGSTVPELRHWTALHTRRDGLDHVRVDFLSTIVPGQESARPAVRIAVGGTEIDVGADRNEAGAGEHVLLPLLDRQRDSVLVSEPVPPDHGLPEVRVLAPAGDPQPDDVRVDLASSPPQPVWLMIVNYCIQGLNDLFDLPLDDPYPRPRTYMALTMRDERGTWSSRPGSGEDGDPDGYALTFEGHRYFGIPSMWAFNAAVLTMIAHDCPDDLEQIQADVTQRGTVVPVNAGFGAHRTPYYTARANLEEIRRGRDAIAAFLPGAPAEGLAVYYPDQRLYGGTPQEYQVYADNDELVRYLVLDRASLCHSTGDDVQQRFFPAGAPDFLGNRLLHDPRSGARILPIEDAVREAMVGGSNDESERGKAARRLREVLLLGLRRNAVERGSPVLLVYGDDADKASGNGWFDGDYSGRPVHFNDKYQATLCWLRDHPWVRVVTVADRDVAATQPVPLSADLASATCPSVDPQGGSERDRYGNLLHFDSWEHRWAATRSPWLDTTLGQLSAEVERALVNWPPQAAGFDLSPDPELVDLAWLTFLGLHHEMMWNKEPLEGGFVNRRLGVIAPEDFVVAASLQLRNAHVYLAAAVWAGWAMDTDHSRTYLNEGKLIEQLRAAGVGGRDALHWDHDLLPTDILYNLDVLAVLDRNGGRITHLFAADRGRRRAICVSGTPKAYQWTGPAPGRPEPDWLTCDGGVLENTVCTPNHLYIACDLQQSLPIAGRRLEERPRQPSPRDWLYPDTFNEYEATLDAGQRLVHYRYGPPVGPPRPQLLDDAAFHAACVADQAGKAAPRAGAATGVVWHDGPAFSKTIRLDGSRLNIHYQQAPAGHVVANEFCLDVRAAMTRGEFQGRSNPDDRSVRLTGPSGVHVTVTARSGCELARSAQLPDLEAAEAAGISAQWLRYHRVLTDAVPITSPAGGDFRYTVDVGFTA